MNRNMLLLINNIGQAIKYSQHLKNRQRLIDEGKVPAPDVMTLTPNKVNTLKQLNHH